MNILFLSSKSPYPLKDGHSLRTYNLLKQVSKNNNIFFLTYFLNTDEEENFNELKKVCRYAKGFRLHINNSSASLVLALFKNIFSELPFVAQKYRSKEMINEIKRILNEEKIDLVHVDILPLMNYFELFKSYPVILVEHNVESLLLRRRIRYTKNIIFKFFLWTQYLKLFTFEKRQIGRAKCCISVSNQEKEILKDMSKKTFTEVIPNGVDVNYFYPQDKDQEKDSLIFVGGLNWFPNLDGMLFFYEKILPVINKLAGEIEITVIGKENKYFKYAKGLQQLGCVADVRQHVLSAKVFIVPLRIGGGTRLKILDAMAMGKAIVSTSIGCEGLDVENGVHLIIEDNPYSFAKAVVELLNNGKKRKWLGENARRLTEEKYNWELIGKKMNEIYTFAGKQ
jgi:glycosyltransferase involved in cell wall biosynthesis